MLTAGCPHDAHCQALHNPTEASTPASLGTYIDEEQEKA